MTKRMGFSAALAAVVLVGVGTLMAQAPAFKRTILQQVDLSSTPGREAVTVVGEFPPGTETGRHTHPGEEISYVELGPLVLEVDGRPARTLKTGEALMVPAGVIHNAHPVAGSSAKVIATYIIEKGKPPTTPAPQK